MPGQFPYSNDAEGPTLQESENDSTDRDQGTPSPRSELLSSTSGRGNGQYGVAGAMERRRRHRPPERYRRERERVHSHTPSRDLIHLLINQEYEAAKMRKALHTAFRRLEEEGPRMAEAERVRMEAAQHFKALNERRIAAQQEAHKANEELRLYKMQLDAAQEEILRAQEVLGTVERQRNDAEESAARARTMARRLNQERQVVAAREEGRRLGFDAGFRRAQAEQEELREQERLRRMREERNEETGDAGAGVMEIENPPFEQQDNVDYRDEGVPNPNIEDGDQRDAQSSSSSPSMLPIRNLGTDRSPEVVRLPGPLPESIAEPNREPVQIVEPVLIAEPTPITPSYPIAEQIPITQPVPITEPVAEIDPQSETPSIQIYPIDIPPAHEVERDYNTNPPTSKYARQQQPYQAPPAPPLQPEPWPDPEDARRSLHPVPSSSRNDVPRAPVAYNPSSSWDGQSVDGPESEFSQLPPSSSLSSIMLPHVHGESDDGSVTGGVGHGKRKQSWYRGDRDRGLVFDEPAQPQPTTQPQSWYRPKGWNPKKSSSVRARAQDHAFNNPSRSGRFSESGGSTSTRISQLDIVAVPTPAGSAKAKGKDRGYKSLKEKERGLSVINEDTSRQASPLRNKNMGSSSTLGVGGADVPPQVPPKDFGVGRSAFGPQREKGGSLSGGSDHRRRGLELDRELGRYENGGETERRIADQSRGLDPHEVNVLPHTRSSSSSVRGQRPANLWSPAPPSPTSPDEQGFIAHGHTRSMSGATGTSGRSQTELTSNRPSLRRVRRAIHVSEISPPVAISVEPPSQSPSDTPGISATLQQPDLYLSPTRVSQPLPRSRPPSVPTVPNTPTQPTAPLVFPQSEQLPPGFIPQSTTENRPGGQDPIRIPYPSSPGRPSNSADPLFVPIPPSTMHSERDSPGGPPSLLKPTKSDRSRGFGATSSQRDIHLSPNNVSQPLPQSRPRSPVPTVVNTTTKPTTPLGFPQSEKLPPGFVPQSTTQNRPGGQGPIGISFPSSPGRPINGADPLFVPIPPSTVPSTHESSGGPPSLPNPAMSDRSRGIGTTSQQRDVYLSPNYINQPLPQSRPRTPMTIVNTTTKPTTPLLFPQSEKLPLGFVSQSTAEHRPGGQGPIPVPFPSSPGRPTNGADPLFVPIPPSTVASMRDSSNGPPALPKSTMGDRQPQSTALATFEVSHSYGNPSHPTPNRAAAQPLPRSRSGSILSSVSQLIGMTPRGASDALPPGEHSLNRVPSNTSMRSAQTNRSYARYDPSTYLDPAYFPADTGENIQVNAKRTGGPGSRSRNASNASSLSLSYMTDPKSKNH